MVSKGGGRPEAIYETEYSATLEPGTYRIKGILTDVYRVFSATIAMVVQ